MSLYTMEEACKGCKFAKWIDGEQFYDGEPRFARCEEHHEGDVSAINGRCRYKVPSEPNQGGEAGHG